MSWTRGPLLETGGLLQRAHLPISTLSLLVCVCVRACLCVSDPKQALPVMARMPAVQASAAAAAGLTAKDCSMATGNLQALRLHHASVKSIQRINKTMKVVAASKLKGFKTRMLEVI